jgi:hypothetical protein
LFFKKSFKGLGELPPILVSANPSLLWINERAAVNMMFLMILFDFFIVSIHM